MSTEMTGEGAVQVEMPFAMVHGEPLTEMPRDLYIPPQAMEVFLDAFEGPLDLLLYLIRRQNLNILDIPIGTVMSRLHRGRKSLQKALYDYAVTHGLADRPEDDNEPEPVPSASGTDH